MCTNPYEQLATLKQDASIDEYMDAFVVLISQVEGFSD